MLGGWHAVVRVQVAAADTAAHYPHDRVGGLLQHRIGHVLHPHIAGAIHQGRPHQESLRFLSPVVRAGSRAGSEIPHSQPPGSGLGVVLPRTGTAAACSAPAISSQPCLAPVWECLLFQVLTGPPRTARAHRTVEGMDNRSEIRDFLTSRRARITRNRRACPPTAAPAASPDCAARKSRCRPGSASTTTPVWNAATPAAPPTPFLTHSPARCSWTRPSARTCSTSPARPTLLPRRGYHAAGPGPRRDQGTATGAPSRPRLGSHSRHRTAVLLTMKSARSGQHAAKGSSDRTARGAGGGADFHFAVRNAADTVSVQEGISVTEALIRLRAFAFSSDRLLADVAQDASYS